jgi:hypothetical protein
MASPRTPQPRKPGSEQLGNGERGRAHWPLDLELHPEREEEPAPVRDIDWDDEDED